MTKNSLKPSRGPQTIGWVDCKPSAREEVLAKVFAGEMTIADAEAWCKANEEQPFEFRPEPAEFDPMRKADWTLAMAMAWIIWRTPEAVRLFWHEYLEKCIVWHWKDKIEIKILDTHGKSKFQEVSERYLADMLIEDNNESRREINITIKNVSLKSLEATTADNVATFALVHNADKIRCVPTETRRQLQQELENGNRLIAYGRRPSETRPGPIERREWEHLTRLGEAGAQHDAVFRRWDHEPQYLEVRVRRDDVTRLWPGEPAKVAEEVATAVPLKPKRGRKPGSGSYEAADQPLIEQARRRIADGQQQTKVIEELALSAVGGGTLASRADRLRKRLSVSNGSGE